MESHELFDDLNSELLDKLYGDIYGSNYDFTNEELKMLFKDLGGLGLSRIFEVLVVMKCREIETGYDFGVKIDEILFEEYGFVDLEKAKQNVEIYNLLLKVIIL